MTGVTTRRLALLAAVVLTGLSAGFFYTYEVSVTVGLDQVDDATYVSTFKAINATIRNFWFAVIFFGPVPVIAAALVLNRHEPVVRTMIGLGLLLYLATVGITFIGNVPLNNELALVDVAAASDARADFEATWNRLNLMRTVTVVVGFLALVAGVGVADVSGRAQPTKA